MINRFRSGRLSHQHIGITSFTEDKLVLGVIGNANISNDLTVGGDLNVPNIIVSGTGTVIGDDITTRNLDVTGIATFRGDVGIAGTLTYEDVTNIDSVGLITARSGLDILSGTIGAGDTVGKNGSYLKSTGVGVTWSEFPNLRETTTFSATQDQTVITTNYNPGFVDIFYNGVKLTPGEYNASNGTSIILESPAVVNDVIEVVTYATIGSYSGGSGGFGGGASVTVSDTPPTTPNGGDLWWSSEEAQLKIYYIDDNSTQWVDASSNGGGGTGGSGGVSNFLALSDTPGSYTADKWLKVNSAGNALEFVDAPSGGGGGSDTNDYVDTANLSGTNLILGRTGALADLTVDLSSLSGSGGGSGISNIVEDTTPQLGGDLDLNNRIINGTGTINMTGDITAIGNIAGADITGDNLTVVNGTIYNNGGHTQLNTLNVSGISTVVGVGTFKDNVFIDKTLKVGEKLFVNSIEITTGQTIGEDIVTRNLKATGISTFQGNTTFEAPVIFEGSSYDITWYNTQNKLKFFDNTRATFGNSDDFVILNDGTKTVFNQVGAATTLEIQHGSSRKLDINQSGIIVSGIATATKFDGDGSLLTNLPSVSLNDLSNVSVSNPTNGHVLKWDSSSSNWVASPDQTGGSSGPESYTIAVSSPNASAYSLTGTDSGGNVSGNNADVTAEVGDTITFSVSVNGHPFYVKTQAGTGSGNLASGATNNGATTGSVVFTPQSTGTYYYQCLYHSSMVGTITITESTSESTTIISPVAYAHVSADTAGTGTGMSWGAYNSSNGQMVFTFDTAQPDTNYYVHTNREDYATHNIEILTKSTTGFTTKWTNSDTSLLAPSVFNGVLIVYASTPTISISGGSGSGGIGYGDLSLTSNSASSVSSLTYNSGTGAFVFTPYGLPKATTSTLGGVSVDNTTIQVDANGEISAVATSTLSGLTDTIIGTAQGSNTLTSGDIIKWNGTKWYNVPLSDSIGVNVYNNTSSFPSANANAGQLAYSTNDLSLYYSNASSWTSQRLVTTNNTSSSDFATILGTLERTYDLKTFDYTDGNTAYNNARKILRLVDDKDTNNNVDISLASGAGLSISRTTNAESREEIEISSSGGNYSISAVEVSTNQYQSKLRLTDSISTTDDDILLKGADGLKVEWEDANTLVFRNAPTATQYTDNMAKDAAALMFTHANASHTGITFNYNAASRIMDVEVDAASSTDTTYTLSGRNTTTTNAFIDLTDSTTPTPVVNSIEFTAGALTYDYNGSNSPTINWDNTNKRITVGALVPIQSDWNQSSTSSLDYIKNKPATFSGEAIGLVPSSPANDTNKYLKSDGTWSSISIPSSIDDLSDVDTTTSAPSPGNILKWDSTANSGSGAWTPQTDSSSGGATNIDDLEDVNIDQAAADNGTKTALQYDTVTDKWINVASTTIPSIEEKSNTSSSIVSGADGNLTITGYRGYVLYKIKPSVASWVRIYCDETSRTNDSSRSHGNDPLPGSGVIAEVLTTSADQEVLLTPGVMGFNNDSSPSTNIYLAINNRSGSAAAVTVTLTVLKIGE